MTTVMSSFKGFHDYSHVLILSSYRASMTAVMSSFKGVHDYSHVFILRASMTTDMSSF